MAINYCWRSERFITIEIVMFLLNVGILGYQIFLKDTFGQIALSYEFWK